MTAVAGRTALVTGAAHGMGRLLALELAGRGAAVVLWDLDGDSAGAVAQEIRAAGGLAHPYVCDVGDRHDVRRTADAVRGHVGDVDILVNNAGVISGRRLLELTDEEIERTFAVNTLAHFWTTRAFLPAMIARDHGHVVTIASASGLAGVPRMTDYAASKHAALGFADSLRAELAQVAPGVRTTVVCPYYVDTGMFAGARTRFPRLLPILRAEDVVDRVVRAVERDEPRVLLPPLVHLLPMVTALPVRWGDRVLELFGVSASMERFVGRGAA